MSNQRYPIPFSENLSALKHMQDENPNAYIAGPMRGHEMNNFPSFFEAALVLRQHGWGIENPAEYDIAAGVDPSKQEKDWPITVREMLRTDFRLILEKCNAIIMLEGWQQSVGARMELAIAYHIGLPVFELLPAAKKLKRLDITKATSVEFTYGPQPIERIDPFENVERAGL